MHKIKIILLREYFTRVKKRSFLLTTFLVPLLFIGMYVGIFYMSASSLADSFETVYIIDEQGSVGQKLQSSKNVNYVISTEAYNDKIEQLSQSEESSSILLIPTDFYEFKQVQFLSISKPSVSTQNYIEGDLNKILQQYHYKKAGIDTDIINNIDTKVKISAKEITVDGESKDSYTEVAMGIAMGLSMLVYITLFLYGSQVMRGVIEEKSSRIVEVIISSVKPFELMMGKIIGIGLVGLTQFLLWIILSVALSLIASTVLLSDINIDDILSNSPQSQLTESHDMLGLEITAILDAINLPQILICFIIFFLGGYLLYSALFAAVGSAVDSETEASQFTMPITMPLLLTYILSMGLLIHNPHGAVATTLSFIPFTSPIAMLVRIPFGVPTWQIVLSALLLIGGFIFTTWIASRIYRVGILMHGKKVSYKELLKWFKYKS